MAWKDVVGRKDAVDDVYAKMYAEATGYSNTNLGEMNSLVQLDYFIERTFKDSFKIGGDLFEVSPGGDLTELYVKPCIRRNG